MLWILRVYTIDTTCRVYIRLSFWHVQLNARYTIIVYDTMVNIEKRFLHECTTKHIYTKMTVV